MAAEDAHDVQMVGMGDMGDFTCDGFKVQIGRIMDGHEREGSLSETERHSVTASFRGPWFFLITYRIPFVTYAFSARPLPPCGVDALIGQVRLHFAEVFQGSPQSSGHYHYSPR